MPWMAVRLARREGFGVAVSLGGETAQLDAVFMHRIDPKLASPPGLAHENEGPC